MSAVFAGASLLLKDISQLSIEVLLSQAKISISVFGKTCSVSDSLSQRRTWVTGDVVSMPVQSLDLTAVPLCRYCFKSHLNMQMTNQTNQMLNRMMSKTMNAIHLKSTK